MQVLRVIAILAIGLGGIDTSSAQELFPSESTPTEFTPICNECIHMLGWSVPDSRGQYYFELFLLDESRPEDRRRIYKGPSKEAFVTVTGTPVVEIQTCAFGMLCSDPATIMLIPQGNQADPDFVKQMRLSESLELLHDTGESLHSPQVPGRIDQLRSVVLDLTATGQRGCDRGIGKRRWNIGTRMTIALSPELVLKIRNLSITEHRDGRWTWEGEIKGDHEGSVVLTADDCKDEAFVTIKSDVGNFAIQPVAPLQNVAYRIVESPQTTDCNSPISGDTDSMFSLVDAEAPDANVAQTGRGVQTRYVSLDEDEFKSRMSRLRYLLGVDRDHDVGFFLNPLMNLKLTSDVDIQFDIRHGGFSDDPNARWSWSGCVAGSQDGKLQISVDKDAEVIRIAYSDRSVQVWMHHVDDNLYQISSSSRSSH